MAEDNTGLQLVAIKPQQIKVAAPIGFTVNAVLMDVSGGKSRMEEQKKEVKKEEEGFWATGRH